MIPDHVAPRAATDDPTGTEPTQTVEFEARCLQLLQLLQGVGPVTFPAAPQPPMFALRKPEMCAGVPDVTVPVKYKLRELYAPPAVKCREVLRQALHPFKPIQCHLG